MGFKFGIRKPRANSRAVLVLGFTFSVAVLFFENLRLHECYVVNNVRDAEASQQYETAGQMNRPHRSLGRKIVEEAFERSYAHFINHNCSRFDTFFDCLGDFNQTTTTKSHWPWWFVTLIRDAAIERRIRVNIRGRGLHAPWHWQKFPSEDLRLCSYEKGGSKNWEEMLQTTLAANATLRELVANKSLVPKKRAVFLRDLLDRYLSAYIDKCEFQRNEGHCETLNLFLRQQQANHSQPPLQPFLDTKYLFDIYTDIFPLTWNIHFFPEALYCDGLYQNLHQYEFVGSLGRNMYRDLARFAATFPSLENAADATFKYKAKIDINNTGVERAAASKVLKYYTPRTVKRILEVYSIDYMALGLPIPEWAETLLAREFEE